MQTPGLVQWYWQEAVRGKKYCKHYFPGVLKQYTREMKSQRWEAKEAEKKDMKELLKWSDRSTLDIEEGYNTAYRPWWWDSNKEESWDSRQIYKLLNITGGIDRSVLDTTALRPNIPSLDEKPEVKELLDAINAANKVKPLEWVVYLQNSENMAGLNSPLACTNWFCTSGKLNKDHKTGKMYCVLCIVYRHDVIYYI